MKKLYTLFAVVLISVLFTGQVLAAWGISTSFETTDGTTTPTDGNDIIGTGDGIGWSGNWADVSGGAGYDYDNQVTSIPDGSWAVVTTSGSDAAIKRAFTTSVSSGIVHVAMRVDSKTGAGARIFFLRSSSPLSMWNVEFDATNIVLNGATSATVLSNYTAGQWYDVNMNFDTTVPTAKARVDDGAWSSSVASFNSSTGDLTEIRFLQAGAGTGPFYWDEICEGQEPTGIGCAVATTTIPPNGDFWFFLLWGLGIRPVDKKIRFLSLLTPSR